MQSNVFRDHSPELKPYWEGLAQGRLLLPHCLACGRAHWYPRGICPHCFGTELEARPASGQGVVRSHTHAPGASAAIAYVTLDEGPTLLTRIVDADPASVAIGQRVELAPVQADAQPPVPLFKPCA